MNDRLPRDHNLPEDLVEFLARGGQLRFDSEETVTGAIKLKPLDRLTETKLPVNVCHNLFGLEDPYVYYPGYYEVPVYDLVEECEMREPEGTFFWLPKLAVFGSFDYEQRGLVIFAGVTWPMIVREPLTYLEGQWEFSGVGEQISPWLHFPFVMSDRSRKIEPYPARCAVHDMPIVRRQCARHDQVEDHLERDPLAWLDIASQRFPHPGVPVDETTVICCDKCVAAEHDWVAERV